MTQTAAGLNGTKATIKRDNSSNNINWLQTIIHKQGKPEKLTDLVYKGVQNQASVNQVIIWDTSASTLRNQAAAKAKGIILKLFEQAYLNRQRIGLLEFSADNVRVITLCQRVNREFVTEAVTALSVGGNTPIDRALLEAGHMLKQAQNNQPDALSKIVLITDGFFKTLPERPKLNADIVIVDINQRRVKIGHCEALSKSWNAELIHSQDLI